MRVCACFYLFYLKAFSCRKWRHKCCWLSNIFKNFKKMKKGKITNKNSIKICKVFVTSLSEIQQCFPPLWLRHSSFAAGAGEVRAGIKRCPPQIYLVITIPHLKASDCFNVHFVKVLGCISTILIWAMFAIERCF